MKKPKIEVDKKFKAHWKNYVVQSFLATLVIFVLFLILNLSQAVVIASIGASAFIVFAMPHDFTARPRNIIGGHLVGVIAGSLLTLVPQVFFLHSVMVYSLAVGLSILIMVITDTEHPPASGTALGIAIKGFSLNVVIAVIVSAVILSLVRRFLKPYLKNLV